MKTNLNRLKISLFFSLLLCWTFSFSQDKNTDAYFLLSKNDSNYVLEFAGGNIDDVNSLFKIRRFNIYNRTEYKKRKDQDEKDKKEGLYVNNWSTIPKTLFFSVNKKAKKTIKPCNLKQLHIVNYKWIYDNTWTENNPNILFKDLYFLYKIGEEEYAQYKVVRSIVIK